MVRFADGGTAGAGFDDNYSAMEQDPDTGEWVSGVEAAKRKAAKALQGVAAQTQQATENRNTFAGSRLPQNGSGLNLTDMGVWAPQGLQNFRNALPEQPPLSQEYIDWARGKQDERPYLPSIGETFKTGFAKPPEIDTQSQWNPYPSQVANDLAPQASTAIQVAQAGQMLNRFGLSRNLLNIPDEAYTDSQAGAGGYDPSRNRISISPGSAFSPDKRPQEVAIHESLHAMEQNLTQSERDQLRQLMADNPPPNGIPTAHHPPGGSSRTDPVQGLTDYLDYLFGGYLPDQPGTTRKNENDPVDAVRGEKPPSIPIPILQFLRDHIDQVASRKLPKFAEGGTATAGTGEDDNYQAWVQDDTGEWVRPDELARRRAAKLAGAGSPMAAPQTSGAATHNPAPVAPPPAPMPPGPDMSYLDKYKGVVDTKTLPQFAVDALNGKQPNALDKVSTAIGDKLTEGYNAATGWDPGHVKEKVRDPATQFAGNIIGQMRGLPNGAAGYGLGDLQGPQIGEPGGQAIAKMVVPQNAVDAAMLAAPLLGQATQEALPLLRGLTPAADLTSATLRAGIDTSAIGDDVLKQLGTSKKELDAIIAKPGSQRTKDDMALLQRAIGWEEPAAVKPPVSAREPDMPAKLPTMAQPDSGLAPDITARLKANVEGGLKPDVPPAAVENPAQPPAPTPAISISPEDAAAMQAARDAHVAQQAIPNPDAVAAADALGGRGGPPALPPSGTIPPPPEQPSGLHPWHGQPAAPGYQLPDPNRATKVDKVLNELTGIIRAPIRTSTLGLHTLRMGVGEAISHPPEAVQAIKDMVMLGRDPENISLIRQRLDALPYINGNAPLGTRWADFVQHGGKQLSQPIADKVLESIPGLGTLLKRNTQMGFGYLESLQKQVYNSEAARIAKLGDGVDSKMFQDAFDAVRHAGGSSGSRGSGITPALGYSPSAMLSRFKAYADVFNKSGSPLPWDAGARAIAVKNLLAIGGLVATVNGIGAATGGKLNVPGLGPTQLLNYFGVNTKIGKVGYGSTSIDPSAGYGPILRLFGNAANDIASGDKASLESHLTDYARGQLGPVAGNVVSLYTGKDWQGKDFGPKNLLQLKTQADIWAPIAANSIWNAANTPGGNVAASLPSLGAMSVSTTPATPHQQLTDAAQQQFGKPYDNLYAAEQAQTIRQLVDSGKDVPISQRQGPWWTARDDALSYWKANEGTTATDPLEQEALKISSYSDLQPKLTAWLVDTYGTDKSVADSAVAKFLTASGIDKHATAYRKDALDADPGLMEAWQKAYDAGETKWKPDKWALDFVKGK